ncbi:MAG: PilN domain-containing protein [Deltaproteobacteria bacterium]|jgi:type IV pilus assembly protein PilN|nr:PilN domain-containing protein [Deltaproteobacteria bacterium]
MIRINLLPFRAARKKENIRRQVSIFLLSLAFMLIILFYFNFSLSSKIGNLNTKIKETQTELDKYAKINKEIEEIKKKLDNLKKKMAVMDTLEANRFAPIRLMDTMTQVVVPKRMWFTNMQSKDQKVSITGVALDNTTVADFMVRLENSGLFNEVDLKTLKQPKGKKGEASRFKTFSVVCVKKPLVEPEKDKKPAKAKAKK